MSYDPNDPVNRKIEADRKEQVRRLRNEAGGTAYEARRLTRSGGSDYRPGPYDPSERIREDWRGIYARMSEKELEKARDEADEEWTDQVLSEYPDEWKKGFSRMQLDLIEDRLRELRRR